MMQIANILPGQWPKHLIHRYAVWVHRLARAVNDRLTPGTDVFVAEMGTYGPGEIARLCRLFPPEVAAITTIGEGRLDLHQRRTHVPRPLLEPHVRFGFVHLARG